MPDWYTNGMKSWLERMKLSDPTAQNNEHKQHIKCTNDSCGSYQRSKKPVHHHKYYNYGHNQIQV
ncbi:hypothetical protein J6590_038736 [Homalodisca vitripennis]|nr:hypothetical protein J6590_038736 [Homalodisca vitripennis]